MSFCSFFLNCYFIAMLVSRVEEEYIFHFICCFPEEKNGYSLRRAAGRSR